MSAGHGTACDPGCGCRGNAIPPTPVLLRRIRDREALARVLLDDGFWCGVCDEPSWSCRECRATVLHGADAVAAYLTDGAA
jgi:hypothetical protein